MRAASKQAAEAAEVVRAAAYPIDGYDDYAHLADRCDALIHYDETTAVEPLAGAQELPAEEAPETFPTGV